MKDFRDALEDCALKDLGYEGVWYTWEWGRLASNNIHERLDRGVANSSWCSLFPQYRFSHLLHSISDHCPTALDTCYGIRNMGTWRAKFEAAWLLEDSCDGKVRRLWVNSMGDLHDRLVHVCKGLNRWYAKIRLEKGKLLKSL